MLPGNKFDHAEYRGTIVFSKDINYGDIIRLNIFRWSIFCYVIIGQNIYHNQFLVLFIFQLKELMNETSKLTMYDTYNYPFNCTFFKFQLDAVKHKVYICRNVKNTCIQNGAVTSCIIKQGKLMLTSSKNCLILPKLD